MSCGKFRYFLTIFIWRLLATASFNNDVGAVQTRQFDAKLSDGILCSFQHMEFYSGNDRLYIGAINRIYQLDVDLNLEQAAMTGPMLDSDTCYPHSLSKCSDMTKTNNWNKLLKIDAENNRVVACGSVRQGLCELRKLGNVSKVLNDFSRWPEDPRTNDFVASIRPDQTTVAFIGREGRGGNERSLYVGSSRTNCDTKLISDSDQFPTFTSRRMPAHNMDPTMFSSDLAEKEAAGLLTDESLAKHGFRVNFISAFEGNQNGYFVLNYPKIQDGLPVKDDIRSYVAQVCMRGDNGKSTTNSYFEIPITSLSWLGGKQQVLKRVITSATAEVGTGLQQSLEIKNTIGGGNPEVLFASFATEGEFVGGSTLSMFPLYELDKIYHEIVTACLNGQRMNHIEWQRESNIPCNKINFPISEPLCSNGDIWDIIGLFQSSETKQGYTIFESNNTVVTSIAVTKQGHHTIVFMGTKDGRLLKLRIDSKPSGKRLPQPYEEIQIDSHSDSLKWKNLGSPSILADMRLDNDLTRLYIMSERKLVSLPLHDCSKFRTCFDCLDAGDPFCGWCTLDNKCTAETECPKGQDSYATSESSNCPKMQEVTPSALPVSSGPKLIKITISNIPRPKDGEYTCVYGGGKTQTEAVHSDTTISCMSPSKRNVPELQGKEVSVPLSLCYTKNGEQPTIIASTEIVFYDCNNFKSCMPCLDSREFECHWCTNDNQCHQNGHPCRTYPGNLEQAAQCPRLLQVVEPRYIHQKHERKVKLKVGNLREIKGNQPRFNCKFTIEGQKPRMVNATRLSSYIECGKVIGFLPPDQFEADARVDLFWNNNFLVDNPNALNVTMYRCSRGAEDNCGKCLRLNNELACGWCEKSKKCSLCDDCVEETCTNDTGGLYDGWLDEAQVCTNPEIIKFYPMSATPGGKTKITIEGINFGKVIKPNGGSALEITVAGHNCEVTHAGSEEPEKITCLVEGVRGAGSGPVYLCILTYDGGCKGTDYSDTSMQTFQFVEPELEGFEPEYGLVSGGSLVTLTGNHLDIGNSVAVQIGNRNCPVVKDSVTPTQLKCRLTCDASAGRSRRHSGHRHRRRHPDRGFYRLRNSNNKRFLKRYLRNEHLRRRTKRDTKTARVELSFDDNVMHYHQEFHFERDLPTEKNIRLDRRESIQDGGMRLKITGNSIHLAQNLVLEVSHEGHTSSQKCQDPRTNTKARECLSPTISGYPTGNYTAKLRFDDCLVLGIGFIKYTKNPYLNRFSGDDNTLRHQSGPIIITGNNLCPNPLNCDETSAKVQIGDEFECNVTDLDKDKLVCVPPPDASGKYPVMVRIGGYSQTVGSLQFESSFPKFVYVVIPLFVLIVVAAIVIACIVHKRAGKKMKEVKEKQMQYDMMEAKVAKECKEAFAELQTDMQSDLDNMTTVGIPFRQRSDYIMRVLFPEPEMYDKIYSQVMSTPYVEATNRFMLNGRQQHRTLCTALGDFDKLLENKKFLLIFIYTLERQKKFSMKDRSNVAGLLMVVLQDRLQYATRILEELLSELIREVMETKSNPRLLLRRSESVAEKMLTHWFSILLHGFLQECAGEPLFTLYRAIRAQLDKGPVDAITGFAKYSLNQDKLLRQAVSYEMLVLIVLDHEDPAGRELRVKVLDCDTITQTKEKIIALKYRNQPQSAHPSPDLFDLEMNTDVFGSAVLNDEDKTSAVEGGWKRLNTLLHYKVKDRTKVKMMPKKISNPLNQSMNSNHSFGSRAAGLRYNGSGHRLINDGAGSLPRHVTSAQGSRSTTPTLVDDGKRPYHLMKQHDNEPRDGGGDGSMMVSEIYLTRLLATKGTVQKFVDDLFETIFSVVQRGHALPLAIKHIFDFFDDQAAYYGITDPNVVHSWKSNSLPLRFWVNLIKNPEFLFDIKKTALVDSCLSVIAGTFMDSCSTADQNLGKDSATGKLLYAKDLQNYKRWVTSYYDEISGMDQLSPQDMQCFLQDESRTHGRSNTSFAQAALTELYLYVQRFNPEILDALNRDPDSRNQRLAQRLEQVSTTMTSTV